MEGVHLISSFVGTAHAVVYGRIYGSSNSRERARLFQSLSTYSGAMSSAALVRPRYPYGRLHWLLLRERKPSCSKAHTQFANRLCLSESLRSPTSDDRRSDGLCSPSAPACAVSPDCQWRFWTRYGPHRGSRWILLLGSS